MPPISFVEIALALAMVAIPSLIIWGRNKARDKEDDSPRGFGVRVIQLLALFLLVPMIGILTLEGKISGETAGALFGVAVGYTLSGIGNPVPSKK